MFLILHALFVMNVPFTDSFSSNVASSVTANVLPIVTAPDKLVVPETSKLLMNETSLVTVSVSLNDAAPIIVVAPCTYNLLFNEASLVTYTLLLKLASLDNVRFPLIDKSSATINV